MPERDDAAPPSGEQVSRPEPAEIQAILDCTRFARDGITLYLRVGDYRVIFDQDAETLTVLDIGHRKDVYR